MKSKFLTFVLCITILFNYACNAADNTINNNSRSIDNYLLKPTGQYNVGFENFHWINKSICPDPNFNGKNQKDFSPDNKNFCREMMVRIYYPTEMQSQRNTPYYQPFIKSEQERLRKISDISKIQIAQLKEIKIYSIPKAPIVKGKIFPVLLFSPGLGCPAELYENTIGEMVSHGYIVIGINSLFANQVELPNGHVVEQAHFKSPQEIEGKIIPLLVEDLSNVLDHIHSLHNSNIIFKSMDLNHIGAFGHSIGGRIIADASHIHPDWFQAAATLDIGTDEKGDSLKPFTIPFMHEIAASRKMGSNAPPVLFGLGNEGYLVGLSPTEHDYQFSHHMNFSDFSTLQNLPIYQSFSAYLKKDAEEKFSLKLMSHEPTKQECNNFSKYVTFVLSKKDDKWNFYIYQNKKKIQTFDVNIIYGLSQALANLPSKPPEMLSDFDIQSVRKILLGLHHSFADFLGDGEGTEITSSVNTYLLQFFNTYLKGDINPILKKCDVLSKDTYIKCGPGIF
jgi:hypothetical protein